MRAGPTRARRGGIPVLVGVMIGALPVRTAAEEAPAPPPLWTATPTPVDRSRETRERIPSTLDRDDLGADAVTLRVDRFPQLDEAASFRGEGRRWILTDVAIASSSWVCTMADGARRACGVRMRARYSRLLQGARLVCSRAASDVALGRLAGCRIKGVPVAETVKAFESAVSRGLERGKP